MIEDEIIVALRKLRNNTQTYYYNSIKYGINVKRPFPNSVWAYNMDSNFLEFIVLKKDKGIKGNQFRYFPANKANKRYIIISSRVPERILEIYWMKMGEERIRQTEQLCADFYAQLKQSMDEEVKYWLNQKTKEDNSSIINKPLF
jgi:hypothetical protein